MEDWDFEAIHVSRQLRRVAVFGMVRFDGIDQSDRAALKDMKTGERGAITSCYMSSYCVTRAIS